MADLELRRLARTIVIQGARIQALELERRSQHAAVDVAVGDGEDRVTVPVPEIYSTAKDAADHADALAADLAALDVALAEARTELEAAATELAARLAAAEGDLATTAENIAAVEQGVADALTEAADALAQAHAVGQQVDVVAGAAAAAQADADAAQSTASSAQSAASAAQGTADAAKADAAAAAGVASGKADVLIQSATPAAAFRVATTLWIDTTGGANTPKRWSGSAWVAVTDKAATDAAAAAAAAQTKADQAAAAAAAAATAAGNAQASADGKNTVWYQSTAPAGTSHKTGDTWFDTANGNRISRWSGSAWTLAQFGGGALANGAVTSTQIAAAVTATITQAQSDATAAQQQAASAASAAATAQTTADGKNRITYGASAPSSTTPGRPGDIFWVRSGSTITGQYLCTAGTMAATGNTWAAQTLTSTTIANLDAGKITTGTLDAGRIAAGSITGAMVAADTITAGNIAANAVTASELAAGAITAGSAVIANGAIGTAQIGTGQITNALIADATIQSAKIASLDAGKITAGVLDAARIAARSITADKVLIGTSQNLLVNGALEVGGAAGWDSHLTFDTEDKPNGLPGSMAYLPANTTMIQPLGYDLTPITPGVEYLFEAWVRADKPNSRAFLEFRDQNDQHAASNNATSTGATNGGWRPVAGEVNATGSTTGALYPINSYVVPTTWTKIAARAIFNEGVTSVRVGSLYLNHTSGTEQAAVQRVAGLRLRPRANASLIVDGAVTADKVAANAITAAHMVAGTITAASGILADAVIETAKIKDAAVTNAKIASLEVGKLTAASATVQTVVAEAIWAAKISASKIVAGDIAAGAITTPALAAGAITAAKLSADAIDGKTITGATVRTAATGKRLQIDSTGTTSGQLRFYSGASTERDPAYIVASPAGTGSSVVMAGGTTTAYPANPPSISLVNDGTYTPYISMKAGQVEILAGLVVDAGEAIVLKTTEALGLEAADAVVVDAPEGMWLNDARVLTSNAMYSVSVSTGQVNDGAQVGPVAITFPSGQFTSAPRVSLSVSNARCQASFANVSSSGMNVYVANYSGGNAASCEVHVVAVASQ